MLQSLSLRGIDLIKLQELGLICRSMDMGTYKAEKEEEEVKNKTAINTCLACLWSFLVSMVGGLILAWWNYVFHPTNRQLWLVPFGLILLVTPVLAWFAAFISETCNCNQDDDDGDDSKITQVV